MKVRILPILLLILFVLFALVSISRGERSDPPQSAAAETPAPAETPLAPALSEPAETEPETPSVPDEPAYTTVDASWFDDAAFVGDSVSLKLSYYAAATGALGNAQFFASGSLGSANAMWDLDNAQAVHPSYQGETMLAEDCVAASGAGKLFIMLGMNDLAVYGIDGAVENYQTLIARIVAKCPGLEVYVQSMTPMTSTSSLIGQTLNPEGIKQYNDALRALCQTQGWHFVDVASVMYDESGSYLRSEYCSDPEDMGVHFTEAGCLAWVTIFTATAHKKGTKRHEKACPDARAGLPVRRTLRLRRSQ